MIYNLSKIWYNLNIMKETDPSEYGLWKERQALIDTTVDDNFTPAIEVEESKPEECVVKIVL